MNEQQIIDYERISRAIRFILEHHTAQPSLEAIAEQVHLSPYHFQRLFTEWAGVSPKKFLQYISIAHAKQLLKGREATLFDTAMETGLSGTARLHDLFIKIEGMTPGEYKNGGQNLHIRYSFSVTQFGRIIIANTEKGICFIAFQEDDQAALNDLKQHFPHAAFSEEQDILQQQALKIFTTEWTDIQPVQLHLKGTPFQLKVWEALLTIPMGQLSTYGQIAGQIQHPAASRAVGTAIGSNPVAFLIPCHRVIQSSGIFGGYMWGSVRKTALIGWEQAQVARDALTITDMQL